MFAHALWPGDLFNLGRRLKNHFVADIQLIAAVVVWVWADQVSSAGFTPAHMASVVSLSGGALFANVVSVVLLVVETVSYRRR